MYLQEDKDVWKFQNKVSDADPLEEWTRLKEDGTITVGSQLERDPTSERLGSEGLVDVRIDELLPYIDQGYVDETADVMGGLRNLFGGGRGDDKKNQNTNTEQQDTTTTDSTKATPDDSNNNNNNNNNNNSEEQEL